MTTQTVTIERYKIELALEALGKAIRYGSFHGADWAFNEIEEAITAIKEVLQSNEQGQKPVEFDVKCDVCKGNGLDAADNNYFCSVCAGSGFVEKMFYPTPPKRTWVGLTDEEIMAVGRELGVKCRLGGNQNIDFDYARAIEAKLRSKNGY